MWSILTNPIVSHLIAAGLGLAGGAATSILAGAKAIEAKGKADLAVATQAIDKGWTATKAAAAGLEADIKAKV